MRRPTRDEIIVYGALAAVQCWAMWRVWPLVLAEVGR